VSPNSSPRLCAAPEPVRRAAWSLKVGSSGTPNGLATPAAIDIDSDNVVDYVYAGDLQGNMWKFDVRDSSATNWKVAYSSSGNPAPLFTAMDGASPTPHPQPITERPTVSFGPGGSGLVVLFGTGKFIEASDRTVDKTPANQRPQTFYGIFDANTGVSSDIVSGRGSLQVQTITFELTTTMSVLDNNGNPVNEQLNVRLTSANKVNATTQKGWYIDLVSPANGYEGERQVTDPVLRDGKIIFTTTIPDADPCAYGGRSWLMTMDSLTGATLQYSPFDLNNDKNFNDTDMVQVTVNGVTYKLPVSGLQSTDGLLTSVSIVSSTTGDHAIAPTDHKDLENWLLKNDPGAIGRQSWRQLR